MFFSGRPALGRREFQTREHLRKTIKHIFYSKQPAIFDDFCECDVAHQVLKLCDRLFNFTAKAAHSNVTYSFNLSFENELQGILCVQLLVFRLSSLTWNILQQTIEMNFINFDIAHTFLKHLHIKESISGFLSYFQHVTAHVYPPNWNVSPVFKAAEFHVLRYKVSGPRGS